MEMSHVLEIVNCPSIYENILNVTSVTPKCGRLDSRGLTEFLQYTECFVHQHDSCILNWSSHLLPRPHVGQDLPLSTHKELPRFLLSLFPEENIFYVNIIPPWEEYTLCERVKYLLRFWCVREIEGVSNITLIVILRTGS